MIVGVGIDLIQNSRLNKILSTHKTKFLKKILAPEELKKLNLEKISVQHLAGIFAAKEAVIKSLSGYLGFSLTFQDIIMNKNPNGYPYVKIKVEKKKDRLVNIRIIISISHEKHLAIALAIAELVS